MYIYLFIYLFIYNIDKVSKLKLAFFESHCTQL